MLTMTLSHQASDYRNIAVALELKTSGLTLGLILANGGAVLS